MPKRAQSANFTAAEKRDIYKRDGGICQWCKKPVEMGKGAEFHHIKPLAQGGKAHDLDNGMLLHKSCHTGHYDELHPGMAHLMWAMGGSKGRKWYYILQAKRRKEQLEKGASNV